ncbi:MAG: hypothetical protein C3F14_08205 [Deltaproteobacteria bacterium]|nr:MAG: hypothetical protein C3F14_08205 [Deltaproteobacteria bacterium]
MDLKALAGKPILKRYVLWFAIALAVFTVVGFLVLPPVVKSVLVKQLSEKLHRPVAIRSIRINPFLLSVRVEGFSMKDRGGAGPFVSFEELSLDLEASSIVRGGPVLREILLRSPSVTVIRNEDSTYNFSDILDEFASKPTDKKGTPLRYSLNNIRIAGGSIDFDDRPKHTRHAVRDLSLSIPFLSNLPSAVDVYVRPAFEAKVNGTLVALQGRTKPYSASRDTLVDLNIRDFDIPYYLEYVPVKLKFRVPSGSLDAKTVLTFSQPEGKSPAVSLAGDVTVKKLAVADGKGDPVLRLPSLAVGIGALEPLSRRVKLDNVVISSPEVFLVREKTGVLNVVSLLPDETPPAKADKGAEPAFAVEVDAFRLTGAKASFSDLAAPAPFQAAATLDLSARYKSGPGEDGDAAIVTGLEAKLSSLSLRRRGEKEDAINIPEIGMKGAIIDLVKKTATVEEASTVKGALRVTREKDGTLDLAKLAPVPEGTSKLAAPPPREPAGKPAAPGWLVRVKKASLQQYSIRAVDKTPPDPVHVRISPLEIAAEDISTEKDSKGKASLKATVNKAGKVAVGGTVAVNPVAADMNVDVRTIDLVPFQPYVAERINISLTSGNVSARGRVTLAERNHAFRTTYSGALFVTKLATVDKATSEDFLKWDSLHMDGIRMGTNPLSVAIRQVALTDFYSRVIVTPEGTLNLQGIVKKEQHASAGETAGKAPDNTAGAKPREAAGPPAPVSIETVSFQGGRINFTDHFIKPNYAANLLEVGGRVSGLSSEETRMAEVDLRGRLENYAPLEITGKINPLRNDLFVDLKIDFKDMDMSPLTPYSGRYAGYTIEKGKLTLSLKYLIVKRKLEASNNVFLDQFTFGDAVESPHATKLPVRLAVALLKNRKGEINLDLPVSGSLDDPQFSVWGVVVKIIVNLLVKAATSPFALLGAIFGGGEELSYLEFNYGMEVPDGPGTAKLDTLVKALHERPSLKLEIAGYVDHEKDREALRQSMFDRKVKSQKLKDLVKKGGAPPSLDNVVVDAKEYPEYLKRAYKAEKFPKPRNIIGMAKDLPVPEMEKLMVAHLQVTDDDLRLLAQGRARSVKDYLLASKQVEPERIFLLEPKTLAPEKKEKQKDSRVVFVLK